MIDLEGDIKKRLLQGESEEVIRTELLNKGFLDEDIEFALSQNNKDRNKSLFDAEYKKSKKVFLVKEFFERIGYGLGSSQYINIFFFLTGAPLWLIGMMNGAKALVGDFISTYLNERLPRLKSVKNRMIIGGIIQATSFLIFALAIALRSPAIFSVAMVISIWSGVAHTRAYAEFIERQFGKKKERFMKNSTTHGLFLSGISIIIAGWLLDISLFGLVILCIIIFISLITATLSLAFKKEKQRHHDGTPFNMRHYILGLFDESRKFFNSSTTSVLLLTSAITTIVQILGQSYYGIFIFQNLSNEGFGPYMNVGIVFTLALLASFSGSFITQTNARTYGKFPMLIFGTALMAIMPLTFYYNPHLIPIAMATILGILGATIAGIAKGILTVELIPKNERNTYYKISGVLVSLPLIVFVSLGSLYAEHFYLRKLFLILGMILLLLVIPLYFIILLQYNKKKATI